MRTEFCCFPAQALPGGDESDFILVSCAGVGAGDDKGDIGAAAMLTSGRPTTAVALGVKRRGEAALRNSGLGYTVVRPGPLMEEPGGYKALVFDQARPPPPPAQRLPLPQQPLAVCCFHLLMCIDAAQPQAGGNMVCPGPIMEQSGRCKALVIDQAQELSCARTGSPYLICRLGECFDGHHALPFGHGGCCRGLRALQVTLPDVGHRIDIHRTHIHTRLWSAWGARAACTNF